MLNINNMLSDTFSPTYQYVVQNKHLCKGRFHMYVYHVAVLWLKLLILKVMQVLELILC